MDSTLEDHVQDAPFRVAERFINGQRSKFEDKRSSDRHEFTVELPVAAYDGESFPLEQAFTLVECRDLSAGGIGFLSTRKPVVDARFVAAFVSPASTIYLHLCVARIAEGWFKRKRQYVVGCRFVERLTPADVAYRLPAPKRLADE